MTAISLYLTDHSVIFLVAAGVLGLVVGSFLNVVIHRLPIVLERRWRADCQEILRADTTHDTSRAPAFAPEPRYDLVTPRSQCPHCGHAISALENIPVLSFLWLRGRCSGCGQAISWRYPLVEALTGVLSVVIAWQFGATTTTPPALLLTWSLIALAFIDYDLQILPDTITLPLLWLGLLVNLFAVLTPLRAAVIGTIAGYVSLWLVYQSFKLLTGKEGMGYGDFKLFAALGAWLGWQGLPLTILLASLLGAIVGVTFIVVFGRDRHLPIPFGPFLCLAGWIALLWGDPILRYYLHIARF